MIKNVFSHKCYRMLPSVLRTSPTSPTRPAASSLVRLKDKVMAEGLLALKCGGKLIEEAIAIRSAAVLKRSGRVKNLVIVPGAQAQITAAIKKRRLEPPRPEFIDGRRVTDDAIMRIAAGELRSIVSAIAGNLRNCGVEADSFLLGTFYGKPVGLGNRTGDITRVDGEDAATGLLCGKAVVLAPLGKDDSGGDLSFNADDAAASVAIALGARQLVLATDRNGIEKSGSVIRAIGVSALAGLIDDKTVTGGMVAKARACITAANAGIPTRIINGNDPAALAQALDGKCGTVVMQCCNLTFW